MVEIGVFMSGIRRYLKVRQVHLGSHRPLSKMAVLNHAFISFFSLKPENRVLAKENLLKDQELKLNGSFKGSIAAWEGYLQSGGKKRAERAFRRAMDSKRKLAELYSDKGLHEKARDTWKSIVALIEKDGTKTANFELGMVIFSTAMLLKQEGYLKLSAEKLEVTADIFMLCNRKDMVLEAVKQAADIWTLTDKPGNAVSCCLRYAKFAEETRDYGFAEELYYLAASHESDGALRDHFLIEARRCRVTARV